MLWIELERADLERGSRVIRALGLRASRVRTDPRLDLAVAERLHDVVVGAQVEGPDLVILALARREDEDRQGRATPSQLGDELESIERLEVQIDDRHDRVACLEELERGLRLLRRERREASLLNDHRE